LDAFKRIILLSVLASLIALGFIAYVATDAIQGVKIPDQEYGIVTSKGPVTDGHAADYVVTISTGKTLYIQTNQTMYDYLQKNSSYLFDCRIDLIGDMIIIDSASQPPGRTAT
jgi:hypothetical protein